MRGLQHVGTALNGLSRERCCISMLSDSFLYTGGTTYHDL